LPTAMTFFAAINGQQVGPLDVAALTAKAREGAINRQTLVWRQGMASWAAATPQPDIPTVPTVEPKAPPAGRQFPCGNCGARLDFDPAARSLKCPFCG